MRHPTRAEIDKFNDLLGLIERPGCQDWEIECSDPDRIEEFIDCYSAHANSAKEKFTLMALILGAYEEYHAFNPPAKKMWWKIKGLLLDDLVIHRDHVEYYQCIDEVDGENRFPITKQMRQIRLK